MNSKICLEIVGYKDNECCPFPCDEDRTCGLTACAPTNKLLPAVEALREKIHSTFGDDVKVLLTLLDDEVPDYVREIYEAEHPAIPIILINGKLFPLGRITWPPIQEALSKIISEKSD